jgi:hypothetical protein
VEDSHARKIAEQDRLARQGKGPRDDRLRRNDGREGGNRASARKRGWKF